MILSLTDEVVPYLVGFNAGLILWLVVSLVEKFKSDRLLKTTAAPILFKKGSRINELGQVEAKFIPVIIIPEQKKEAVKKDNWLGDLAKGANGII